VTLFLKKAIDFMGPLDALALNVEMTEMSISIEDDSGTANLTMPQIYTWFGRTGT
jgi:hypothetical protein